MLLGMQSNGNSHVLLKEMQNDWATLEESLAGSYKNKYSYHMILTVTLHSYPKELKTCPHKNLHTSVCSSFIHTCQKLKAIKESFHRWIAKWTVYIQTMEYYYSGLKRNEVSSQENTWGSLKCILLKERSQS